jgi:hypothetical protein
MIRTTGAQVYPAVLPGQVTITDRSTDVLPAPAGAVAAARTVPAIRDQTPVTLQFLIKSADAGPQVHAGDSDSFVMAVKSPADVERLIGRSLSDSQNNTLRTGGALLWRGQPTPSISLRIMQGDKPVADPVTVPAERLSMPSVGWSDGRDGVMLTSTAKKHRLPLATGSLVYTDISDSDASAVRAAVERAGLDPAMVTIHQTPPPPIPPLALYLTAAGLALMTLVVTLSLTRAQVRALRDYLGHLIALGVPLRWARSVVIRQHLLLLTLATILGLAVGLPPVLLATWLISGFELSIPWDQLTVLLVTVYTSALLATYLSSRRLTARSRLGGR